MSSVGMMQERKDRPAYVRFERRPIEDRQASERDGMYRSKDVDFALVTPPYSKDCFEQPVADWLAQMKRDASSGRLPVDWYERYVQAYERWKKGEEMPLDGTPIKGWPVISPAMQKNLTGMLILTVEDLAAVNSDGMRRIGMGAQSLVDKAKAWLSQAKDKGPLTIENAALKAENQALKTTVGTLEARVKQLQSDNDVLSRGGLTRQHFDHQLQASGAISAADILDPEVEPQPQKRRRGQAAPI